MKRLFKHAKRPYEEWDEREYIEDLECDETGTYIEESEYISEESEYYGESEYEPEETECYEKSEYITEESGYYGGTEYEPEEAEYYGESEYIAEEAEYYGESEYIPEESAYYGESEYIPEESAYYGESEYEPEESGYYGETEYEPEEAEYYGETEYEPEESAYYGESEYIPGETEFYEEDYPEGIYGRKGNGGASAIWKRFRNMRTTDYVVAATGVCVLIIALITGGIYASARMVDKQIAAFAGVGSQLQGIELIGEKGLMAVADAQLARLEAAEIVEEEEKQPEYNETEYSNIINVKLDAVSIKKDLKLKFTNKETNKLISNVPFSVSVTDSSGKTTTWTDDDKDGIIYKKGLEGGKYKLTVDKLTVEKYKDYILPVGTETVTVKEEIAYEKVDVKNEIKTESQINAAVEDTRKNETQVESVAKDTVQWVESTVTADTYIEVAKSTVPDPLTLAAGGRFLRTANFTGALSSSTLTLAMGGVSQLSVSFQDSQGVSTAASAIAWSSDNPGVAAVDGNGVVTGVAPGTATISYSASLALRDVSGNVTGVGETLTGSCTVTVINTLTLTLDKTAATVLIGTPLTLNAVIGNGAMGGTLTAESSDTAVATVSVSAQTIIVSGVENGSTIITVKYVENGVEVKATCAVTVKTHPQNDKKTKLLDASGKQLYVLEGEKYREAVYADYYTASQFFLRGDAKYTGWQTIDGRVYFYDASGRRVTGDQVIQGGMYSFDSNGALITSDGVMGIDVSKWNGNIDWEAVKNSGVHYVIIRCGYRGSSQGALIEDPKFEKNIKGATSVGLKIGIYFFTQAVDEVEAVEEASMVLEQIKGYRISYPIFLDVEASGGRGDKIDKATRTAVCKAFCETIQEAGYTAGIYANKTWLNKKLDVGQLGSYKIWLAQYAVEPDYSGRYELWQYSSTGRVSGISGNVDLNMSYLGY